MQASTKGTKMDLPYSFRPKKTDTEKLLKGENLKSGENRLTIEEILEEFDKDSESSNLYDKVYDALQEKSYKIEIEEKDIGYWTKTTTHNETNILWINKYKKNIKKYHFAKVKNDKLEKFFNWSKFYHRYHPLNINWGIFHMMNFGYGCLVGIGLHGIARSFLDFGNLSKVLTLTGFMLPTAALAMIVGGYGVELIHLKTRKALQGYCNEFVLDDKESLKAALS